MSIDRISRITLNLLEKFPKYPKGFVTDRVNEIELIELIQPNLATGPWIAGGAALDWVLGDKVANDIDVWFASEEQYLGCITRVGEFVDEIRSQGIQVSLGSALRSSETAASRPVARPKPNTATETMILKAAAGTSFNIPYCELYKSDNAVTFRFSGDYPALQLIKKRYYESVNHILEDFDISVCKVASDGKVLVVDTDIREQIYKKVFDVVRFHASTFRRFAKYYAKGFTPTEETILKMYQNSSDINWGIQHDSENYNEA